MKLLIDSRAMNGCVATVVAMLTVVVGSGTAAEHGDVAFYDSMYTIGDARLNNAVGSFLYGTFSYFPIFPSLSNMASLLARAISCRTRIML